MKKIFVVLALAAMILFTSCKSEPVSVLSQAKADYAALIADAPDSSNVAFYEVEMTLDNPISAIREGKDVKLVEALTVMQQDSVSILIDRLYDKNGKLISEETEKVEDFWMGDLNMPLDSLNYDLSTAIEALKAADMILPEGDKVTLRAPLSPPFRTYYIFGTLGTFFVAVDAITGEVSKFE